MTNCGNFFAAYDDVGEMVCDLSYEYIKGLVKSVRHMIAKVLNIYPNIKKINGGKSCGSLIIKWNHLIYTVF